jgi:hypothetical protein
MAYESSIRRYRHVYAKLLRFHSHKHYARFGEGMEQTFSDLLRERAAEGGSLFDHALWMFVETSVSIIKEKTHTFMQNRTIKFVLAALCVLFIPLLAMVFHVDGWDWKPFDFIIIGILLVGVGVALSYATSAGATNKRRLIGIVIVGLLFLTYVHLAVGLVDWLPFGGH